ncbi:MAG: hypothetical protein IJ858_06470 [Acidaminococcaceae bacterium]|nr:hypothetical protein [Acidaminococcaceae bacterium]MBR2183051.1 hypothetical protein [Acidaminococcaceae bacterium]
MQIDIHSHIIPGVDDGSRDMETSIALLQMAVESGTTDIIATPHVIDVSTTLTWDAIRRHVEALQKEADARGIPIRIYPGAETELNWDLLELIRKDHSAFCLAGSRYCLMEMPSLMLPPNLEDMIYELQLMDIVPVLAHPERQMQLMQEPEKLLKLLQKGCVAQSNGGSLTGVFGPKAHEKVHMLIDHQMISFMGSDAHNLKHRNTNLKDAREKIVKHWGEATATELLETKPRYILENKELPPALYADRLPKTLGKSDANTAKKKGFFARLFG